MLILFMLPLPKSCRRSASPLRPSCCNKPPTRPPFSSAFCLCLASSDYIWNTTKLVSQRTPTRQIISPLTSTSVSVPTHVGCAGNLFHTPESQHVRFGASFLNLLKEERRETPVAELVLFCIPPDKAEIKFLTFPPLEARRAYKDSDISCSRLDHIQSASVQQLQHSNNYWLLVELAQCYAFHM